MTQETTTYQTDGPHESEYDPSGEDRDFLGIIERKKDSESPHECGDRTQKKGGIALPPTEGEQSVMEMGAIGTEQRGSRTGAAQHDGECVVERKTEHQERNGDEAQGGDLEQGDDSDACEHITHEQASGIPEEYACGREVMGKKAEASSGE